MNPKRRKDLNIISKAATNSETNALYRTKTTKDQSNGFIEVKILPNHISDSNTSVTSVDPSINSSISFDYIDENKQLNAQFNEFEAKSVGNKPRSTKENLSKCPYSPFVYHRFVKQERAIHGNGSKSTILRCRYCALLVQIWVGYRKDKDGRMVAYRKTNIVEDEQL